MQITFSVASSHYHPFYYKLFLPTRNISMQTTGFINPKIFEVLTFLGKKNNQIDQKQKANILLKIALRSLRDVLSIDTSIKILSLLPPYLKPLFCDQWKFSVQLDYNRNVSAMLKIFIKCCEAENIIVQGNNQAMIFLQEVGQALTYSMTDKSLLEIKSILPEDLCNSFFASKTFK